MACSGMGAVCVTSQDSRLVGGAATVPQSVLDILQERAMQIAPLEALAVLQASLLFKQQLQNQDALSFVDTQAVCSALVRGSSSSDDTSFIVSLCHLVWAALSTRIWVEYVPSDDNPADGLSRDGIKDKWAQAQASRLGETVCVPLHKHHAGSLVSAVEAVHPKPACLHSDCSCAVKYGWLGRVDCINNHVQNPSRKPS